MSTVQRFHYRQCPLSRGSIVAVSTVQRFHYVAVLVLEPNFPGEALANQGSYTETDMIHALTSQAAFSPSLLMYWCGLVADVFVMVIVEVLYWDSSHG